MPSSDEHMLWGGLSGVGTYLYIQKKKGRLADNSGMVKAALIGAVSGRLADVFDPPTSPKHRASAHSLLTLMLCAKILTDPPSNVPEENADALMIAAAAYGSHLLADSQTRAGIPLF